MAGLVKAKKYDWKDSNMALFGSDTEREVKKESAQAEPAWEGAGQEVGLKIWRIVNFKVTEWPEEDYGQFFSGDSYIILNTYKPNPDSEELAYDVHFWIGSQSTQDEYGTVAYKTVELDTFLDDKAVQHREVQGRESEMFKSYFKSIMIMAGGAESGFRHVEAEQYTPRLMHFSGDRRVVLKEVPCCRSRLTSGDVFILDLGKTLYQWNGSGSSKNERYEAAMFLSKLKNDRAVDESEVLEEEGLSDDHPFYQALTGDDEEDEDVPDEGGLKELYRVSDASGTLNIEKIKEGDVGMGDFQSGDVFILDIGNECFVWIGRGSSDKEKRNGISYAHKHLMGTNHALVPIVVIKEGQRNSDFSTAIAA